VLAVCWDVQAMFCPPRFWHAQRWHMARCRLSRRFQLFWPCTYAQETCMPVMRVEVTMSLASGKAEQRAASRLAYRVLYALTECTAFKFSPASAMKLTL
jgi:hypothetical protein